MLGILPLRTPRHARFLHEKVSGISVPQQARRRLQEVEDPVREGIRMSRELLQEDASTRAEAARAVMERIFIAIAAIRLGVRRTELQEQPSQLHPGRNATDGLGQRYNGSRSRSWSFLGRRRTCEHALSYDGSRPWRVPFAR